MGNDYRRLKDEADIESVIDYLGIPVYGRGRNKFVKCPLPEHDDQHPTNCHFQSGWNNLYCQSCGKSIRAIDLIMYETGLSYGDAADMLWEIEGRPAWYYDRNRNKEDESFYITAAEAKVIGIILPHQIESLVGWQEDKPENLRPANITPDDSGWIVSKKDAISWQDFMNEKTFIKFVLAKCKRRLARYIDVEKQFQTTGVRDRLFDDERHVIYQVIDRCISATSRLA